MKLELNLEWLKKKRTMLIDNRLRQIKKINSGVQVIRTPDWYDKKIEKIEAAILKIQIEQSALLPFVAEAMRSGKRVSFAEKNNIRNLLPAHRGRRIDTLNISFSITSTEELVYAQQWLATHTLYFTLKIAKP